MSAPRGRGLRPGGVVRAIGRLVVMVAIGFSIGLLFGLITEEPELLSGHLRGESESVPLALTDAPRGGAALEGADAADLTLQSAALGDGQQRLAAQEGQAANTVYTSTSARPVIDAAERRAVKDLPGVAAPGTPSAWPGRATVRATQPVTATANVPSSAFAAAQAPAADATVSALQRRWAIQVGAFSDERAAKRLASTLEDRFPVAVLPAGSEGGRWRVRVQPLRGEEQARKLAEELKRDERLPTWVTPMEGRFGS